eukprot:gene10144-12002_t
MGASGGRHSVYSRYLHNLQAHLSSIQRSLALASASLQMFVVVLFLGYHYLMLHALHVDRHYDVYHSQHTLANFFLSRRLAPTAEGKEGDEAEGMDTDALELEEEEAAPLWALPEDNRSLEAYAHRLQEINLAGSLHQGIYMMQACWVLVMVPQLCLTLRQQSFFRHIVNALGKSLQYFLEVLSFFVALGAFSVLFHVTFGLKLDTYHTFTRSLNRLSLFSFLKKYHKLRYVTMMWEAKDMMEIFLENTTVFCFHLFFFINREIMFVIVRQALTIMQQKEKVSVPQDIRMLFKLSACGVICGWPSVERATFKSHTASSDGRIRMLHGRPAPVSDAYGGILMSRGLAKADSALQEQLAGSVMATMRDPVSVAGEEVRNASADRTYGHANKVMAPAQKRSGRRRKLSKLIRREMARLEKGTQSLHQRLQTCAHAADGVRAHLLDSGTQADVGPALSNIREDPGTVQKAILLELEAWNLIGSTAPEEMARLEE